MHQALIQRNEGHVDSCFFFIKKEKAAVLLIKKVIKSYKRKYFTSFFVRFLYEAISSDELMSKHIFLRTC